MEDHRGVRVDTSTQEKPYREGREITREVDRLVNDAREIVGDLTSQQKKRRSPKRYSGYMSLMTGLVKSEP